MGLTVTLERNHPRPGKILEGWLHLNDDFIRKSRYCLPYRLSEAIDVCIVRAFNSGYSKDVFGEH